ncbi:MAG: GntR family transcriptional regulator, partial [Candidatus Schmidhempelia sp.]|nr:GntR family transcriptional regulator [Candidatus Schmidhempelia sp.]
MWRRARLHNYAGPLYKRIFMLIEAYIKQGLLVADERLPSERRLAQLLEVDRSTVVHALDELCEHGILRRKL